MPATQARAAEDATRSNNRQDGRSPSRSQAGTHGQPPQAGPTSRNPGGTPHEPVEDHENPRDGPKRQRCTGRAPGIPRESSTRISVSSVLRCRAPRRPPALSVGVMAAVRVVFPWKTVPHRADVEVWLVADVRLLGHDWLLLVPPAALADPRALKAPRDAPPSPAGSRKRTGKGQRRTPSRASRPTDDSSADDGMRGSISGVGRKRRNDRDTVRDRYLQAASGSLV